MAESWVTQDFYGLSTYESEVYPKRKDLKLLKVAGITKLLLAVVALCLVGWTGINYFKAARTDAWHLDDADEAITTKGKMLSLKRLDSEAVYWENIMASRTKGWLVLEAMLDLFPSDCGVIVTDCDFRLTGTSPKKDATETGFECRWKIKGHARSEGATKLINRLRPSDNEQITVLLSQFVE